MSPSSLLPRLTALLALAGSAACGSGDAGGGGATRAPARSGDVWVLASPDDRASTPGAILAYVHGLHAFVLDGNDAYLGMTHLTARKEPDGGMLMTLPGGGDVRLVQAGDTVELRFAGGETVALQKRQEVSR